MPRAIVAFAFFLLFSAAASAAPHTHTTPDGLETAPCTCRLATADEARDLSKSPDGWVQDEPRASYTTGEVPFPIVPDWVGTRTRAAGGLAFGDADNDGDQDLFVGTYWANQYPPLADYYNFIYLNSGGVLEANPSWISSDQKHTGDCLWTNINGDAYPDLVVANGGTSYQSSQVFYGRAGLLLTTAGWSNSGGYWTTAIDAADFDRDGDIDIAATNQGYGTTDPYKPTTIYRNLGAVLETAPSWSSAVAGISNGISWGDMDGDGDLDLAVAGWVDWQTGVYRNTGTTLTTTFVWTTGHPERTDKGVDWADVNGDGNNDLAVGGNGAPSWLFQGTGTTLGATPVWSSGDAAANGTQQLEWCDVDRDGDQDLVTIHFSTGHTRIHLNNGGVLSAVADWQYDDASSATAFAFGDLNNDGNPDLAVGCANGPVKVFMNTGAPVGVREEARDLPGPGMLGLAAAPNPFADRITVSLRAADPFTVRALSLYDVSGRLVARMEPPELRARFRTVSWNMPGLAAGVYFVRAEAADGRAANARLVKVES